MSEDNWLESLPAELRDAPYLAKAESPQDALGKLQHAAKLVGTSVRIPGEDASEDDRATFYAKMAEIDGVARLPTHDDIDGVMTLLAKLGYPEEHTGYKLPEISDFEWDSSTGEDLRKYAHKAGMTPGQFTAFATQIAEREALSATTAKSELEDSQKALRTDWGDTLEDREALIRGWMEKSEAPESLRTMLNDRNLDLETMNWLHQTAKQFKGEVTPVSKDGNSPTPTMTPGQAGEKMDKILSDLSSMRDSHPRYRELQQELVAVQRLAMAGR